MKALTNKIGYFLIVILALSACKKETYAPILTIDVKPHIIYLGKDKYELDYLESGVLESLKKNGELTNIAIAKNIQKEGDVAAYIDVKTQLKYTMDDQGDFWTAIYINENYFYPPYKKDAYSDNASDVTVEVKIPEGGVYTKEGGMDFKSAGVFEFKYVASLEGKTSTKRVHVRVYNEYKKHEGLYVSKLELINSGTSGVSLWSDNFAYGKGKTVRFSADSKINRRVKINRLANCSSLKAYLTAETNEYPTEATIGSRKPKSNTSSVEAVIKGEVTEGDKYVAYKLSINPELNPREVETLVVISNRNKNNKTQCQVINISNDIATPIYLFITEYTVKRYEPYQGADAYISSDGRKWKEINRSGQYWRSTFREIFVKKTDFNIYKDLINNWTDEHPVD